MPAFFRCDGVTRRDALRVGALTALGLTLPGRLRAADAKAPRAKSCILLWLDGGPSHLETFDLKPDAPAEIRGEFKPIETKVKGIRICELLPKTAQVMDLFTILRSVTHNGSNHGAGNHLMTTGRSTPVPVGCGNSVSYHP